MIDQCHFSEEFNNVVRSANLIALGLNHEYIGTEHLLLSIIDNKDSAACVLLKHIGASRKSIRRHLLSAIHVSLEEIPIEKLPKTPRAASAIKESGNFAFGRRAGSVSSAHLLYALAKDRDGIAGQVLMCLGDNPEVVISELMDRLG